eukprot:CAMPEP_0178922808 /NCGR_PEP_ID=MMETSP0786-20121207/16364_1 /TAXON_ID=186022 /ORGANISM="Thalassionema frauenfeldii, Strain CCMP 1798" /LENGTH=292 /DNA_ID=CAMNT_0020597223 /DNA_START=167 /DNA_END=1048 /DNA_ORIENTATION=+
MAAIVVVPTVPIIVWYKSACDDRHAHAEQVRTKVRVPNVQTVDDLLVEKCKAGDVLLFDRRWEKCAAGPLSALACLMGRAVLCNDTDPMQTRSVEVGKFDHCGVVVPGYQKDKKDQFDASNLLLLEATPNGILSRPLLTRLEMSQSRSVILLPLHVPGDNRNDEDYEAPEKTKKLHEYIEKRLVEFRDKWVLNSKEQGYANAHSTLSLIGILGFATGLQDVWRSPISPSAWVVLSALQSAGVAERLSDRTAMETKVEDFLRDHRFHGDEESVRLRPGFKFLPPVMMRELSRS